MQQFQVLKEVLIKIYQPILSLSKDTQHQIKEQDRTWGKTSWFINPAIPIHNSNLLKAVI